MIHKNIPDQFVTFAVKMLKRVPGSGIAPGRTAYCQKIPNGKYYLSKYKTVGTDTFSLIENIDFIRI